MKDHQKAKDTAVLLLALSVGVFPTDIVTWNS